MTITLPFRFQPRPYQVPFLQAMDEGKKRAFLLWHRRIGKDMVAWNYLQTLDTPENRAFIAEWRRFTGDEAAITNDPMEATWIGFQLWTQAVAAAGTTDPRTVRGAMAGRSIRAPSGFDVRLDAVNQHLHKPSVIGRMDEKNVIWPVRVSDGLIAPAPWSSWLARNEMKRAS